MPFMSTTRIQVLLPLLCVCAVFAFGQSARETSNPKTMPPDVYLTVLPKPGEDVVALLKRYELYDFPCNITRFFKINGLKEDYRLKSGVNYKLPIAIVTYNGKSIRGTLEITDWKAAKQIEVYNRNALNNGLRGDNFIVSKKLWVPWHLLHCNQTPEKDEEVTERLPKNTNTEGYVAEPTAGKGKRVFPIFGKKYEKTPLLSKKLKGKVFYIVSGHGGPDVGAQGSRAGHTLCEDEYAYDVALRFLRLLISHGATAFMVVRDPNDGIRDEDFLKCDKDETVWGNQEIPLSQRTRLQQRCYIINALTEKNAKAGLSQQTLIEIHVDSRLKNYKTDVFFYFRPGSGISETLALRFQRKFQSKYVSLRGQRAYTGSVTSRHLYMLKETATPRAVYIELGNIKNDWDQQRLVLKNNRQAIANWLLESLLEE
jgi:N-acetylmuramoyl-L-alanine amidase